MKKILATAIATAVITTASVVATTAPANAGNFNFTFGLGGPGYWGGPGWGPGYWGPGNINWNAHVNWCYNHKGPSYNPNTNTYQSPWGPKYCNSPYI